MEAKPHADSNSIDLPPVSIGADGRPLLDLVDVFFPEDEAATPSLSPIVSAASNDVRMNTEGDDPFAPVADTRYVYLGDTHDRVVLQLLDGIRRGDRLMVLTGVPGSGKTMVCQALVETLDRRTLTSFVTEPFQSVDELLRRLLVDFGVVSRVSLSEGRLEHASRRDLAAALHGFLISLSELQASVLVIIDDAQRLSRSVLDEIGQYFHARDRTGSESSGAELHLVLAGEPEMLDTLRQSEVWSLAPLDASWMRLEPLAMGEVAGYVTRRLENSGHEAVHLASGVAERLHQLSKGLPRLINLLCEPAFNAAMQSGRNTIELGAIEVTAEELGLQTSPLENVTAAEPGRTRTVRLALAMFLLGAAAVAAYLLRGEIGSLVRALGT